MVFVLAALAALAAVLLAAGMVRSEPVVATWYGPGFEGTTTASGEPFNARDYTAASRTLEFGTRLIVTYEGRSVVVRVNDRGPYSGADLDLSQAAAEYLGMTAVGVATVDVVQADPSTPVGPYATPAGGGSGGSAEGATGTEDAADNGGAAGSAVGTGASIGPEADPAEEAGAAEGAPVSGADEQYEGSVEALLAVGEDQYAEGEDAERVVLEASTPAPPAPVVAAAPVAQEIVIPPPPEIVVPGSTAERRLDLAEQPAPEGSPSAEADTLPAAPPIEEEAPEPAPEPEAPQEEEPVVAVEAASDDGPDEKELPSETITVLPDTGGPAPTG